jgi:crotonobetainyl-CoA:carnitine CoA-transferase CaiB-like acyl-CoA transferase
MGADVIKVERAGEGDETRYIDRVFGEGNSAYFLGNNRSKRSITLNLADERGKEVACRLIATADVLVENFRVGVMDRLGLGYEAVRAINPQLIYCAISSFGPTGPYIQKPGMDLIVQAMGGVMGLTGEEGGRPLRVGSPIGDFVGAYQCLSGVMLALFHRQRTGEGQKVDVALLDGQVSLLANYIPGFFVTGKPDTPVGVGHPQLVPYQVFQTADGSIVIACLNDEFWMKLCRAMDISELIEDPRYLRNADRVEHRDTLVPFLQERLRSKTSPEWLQILERADVPCARVNTLADIAKDPQVRENEMLVTVEHPIAGRVTVAGVPIKLRGTPGRVTRSAPLLGEHTDEVLGELGYGPAEVTALRDARVV